MTLNRKPFVIVLAAVLIIAAVAAIFTLRRTARPVAVMTAAYAPFAIDLPESGVVQYPQIQTISAQVAGSVGGIYVRAGERIRQGTLLATIINPQVTANARSAEAAYHSAVARAQSASATGGSNVVQAQANVEAARARLAQARQDLANGLQSGLGYGETTAADQRAQAEANLSTASTSLREARRVYLAYSDLYGEKAVSRDQLDTAEARYEQAQAAYNRAQSARAALETQLTRSHEVLVDNLRSANEGFAQAQAQLEAARVQSGSGDVAAAQAEAARAESEFGFAREQAAAMQIRAPYDATVLNVASEKNDPLRPLQPGDAVDVGQPLLALAAQRGFVVRTRVDEQDVINVRLGQRVRITGEDFPGRTLSGRVVEIAPIAQRNGDAQSASRTVATTIVIDQPPAFLRDGMRANVDILTTDLPSAIAIPGEAVVRDSEDTYVFVVRDGIARRQPVRVAAANENSAVIASGLRAGDVVVMRNVTALHDGDAVSIASPPVARR